MRELKRAFLRGIVIFAVAIVMAMIYPSQPVEAACSHVGTVSTKAATCSSAGQRVTKCKKCGITLSTQSIPALGHSMSSATCTSARRCTRCGVTSGSALGHSYSAATCTSAKKCTRCGSTSGSALGHSYSAATCTSAKKCTRCGSTSGSALGHSYSAATCTSAKKCTRCGSTSGSALGHSYSAATCTSAKKCTRCGTTSGSALGHSMSEPTCTKARTCSRCGVTSGSSLGHSYSAATCTSAKKCTRCGVTSGSALGHSYSAATCTSAKKCTRCNATSGNPLGHAYSAATCTSPKKCTRSGCGTTSGTALGHSMSEPTCTKARICSKCGVTSGSSLGHSYSAATCTSPKKCTRSGCGATLGSALGHSYNAATCTLPQICKTCGVATGNPIGHVYSDATCTSPKTCKRDGCGATSGSKLGHDYTAATCDRPETCKRCSATDGSALGHSMSEPTCTTPRTCSRCAVTSGSSLGHVYSAATCTTAKTCTREGCGSTIGTALGHTYSEATCTLPQICSTCGVATGNPMGHAYSDATCTEPATCRRENCGATNGSPLGHKASTGYVTIKEATCYFKGTEVRTCTVCNESVETREIEMKSHNFVETSRVEPGCETGGEVVERCNTIGCCATWKYTLDPIGHAYNNATCTAPQTCSREGCDATVGSPTGHKASSGYVTIKEATCYSKGTEARLCNVCNEPVETREIEMKPHNFVETSRVEPGCETGGKIVETCNTVGCRATRTENFDPIGHDVEFNPQTCWEPTCVDYGYMYGECRKCKNRVEYSPSPLGHKVPASFTRVIIEPSCTIAGEEVKECTVCGEVVETRIIEPMGHILIDEIQQNTPFKADYGCTGYGELYCVVCGGDQRSIMVRRKMDDPSNEATIRVNAALTQILDFCDKRRQDGYGYSASQMDKLDQITTVIEHDMDLSNTSVESADGKSILYIESGECKEPNPVVEDLVDDTLNILKKIGYVDKRAKVVYYTAVVLSTAEYLYSEYTLIRDHEYWYTPENYPITEEKMKEYVNQRFVAAGLGNVDEKIAEEVRSKVKDLFGIPNMPDILTNDGVEQMIFEKYAELFVSVLEENVNKTLEIRFGECEGIELNLSLEDIYEEYNSDNCMLEEDNEKFVEAIIYHGYEDYVYGKKNAIDIPATFFRIYFGKGDVVKRVYTVKHYISEY